MKKVIVNLLILGVLVAGVWKIFGGPEPSLTRQFGSRTATTGAASSATGQAAKAAGKGNGGSGTEAKVEGFSAEKFLEDEKARAEGMSQVEIDQEISSIEKEIDSGAYVSRMNAGIASKDDAAKFERLILRKAALAFAKFDFIAKR
jgi:hypothetical protein